MSKEIKEVEIRNLENLNKVKYEKDHHNNFQLIDNSGYQILTYTYNLLNKKMDIAGLNYYEEFTSLVTTPFFNTKDYLRLFSDESTLNIADSYLNFINLQLKNTFESFISDLFEAKNKVLVNNKELEEMIEELANEGYKEFFEIIRSNLASSVIPKVVTNFIKIYNKEETEKFVYKKLDNYMYEFKNLLINKTSSMLNIALKKLYKNFGINPDYKTETETKKKIPFSDFDAENDLFTVKFDDEKLALEILGLTEPASTSDIKKAYKKMALKYHPDINKNSVAEEMMNKINSAYNLLKKKF